MEKIEEESGGFGELSGRFVDGVQRKVESLAGILEEFSSKERKVENDERMEAEVGKLKVLGYIKDFLTLKSDVDQALEDG